jgi:DNA-binding beta-propeller fold protein YncE
MTRILVSLLILLVTVVPTQAVTVKTVDFLDEAALEVNAAGPVLLLMDEARNRLIAANTLTSSLSVIDCATHAVTNIPMGGRTFQHLKFESITLNKKTGDVYLIGDRCVFVVAVDKGKTKTIPTNVQFESIAVDEKTGNVFVAGRESKELGLIKKGSGKLDQKEWLQTREDLINLNATPPPPIRRVIADNALQRIVAVDGIAPMLYVFDAKNGKLLDSRAVPLNAGGRWHYAGYNEETHSLYLVIERVDRKVIQAARIGVVSGEDVVVPLPTLRQPPDRPCRHLRRRRRAA